MYVRCKSFSGEDSEGSRDGSNRDRHDFIHLSINADPTVFMTERLEYYMRTGER